MAHPIDERGHDPSRGGFLESGPRTAFTPGLEAHPRLGLAMLGGILADSPDPIAAQDSNFHYIAFNHAYQEAFREVFGTELKVGDRLDQVLAHLPEDLEKGMEIWARTLRGETFTIIREFGAAPYERKTYEIRSIPLRDDAGALIGGVHLACDMTARQRAAEELYASQELNRRIIETSQDCIKVTDLDGVILSMSPGGRALLEIEDLASVLGQNWLEFWQGEDRIKADEALKQARAGQVGRFQGFFTTQKGKPMWWDVTASPILDEEGRPERLLIVSHDTTDRKKAEDELRRSEQRYRHLLSALPAAVYACDCEGRVTLYNEQAVALWGQRPELGEACWCSFLSLYRTDGAPLPPEECPMVLALREERSLDSEYIIERPDGSRAKVMIHIVPIRDAAGRLTEMVNVMVDITAIRQAEESLREADRRKDEFLAMLAHELRNPLAPIRNAIQVMRLTGTPDPALQRQRDIVDRQVTHMAHLLNDLLDVSRITRGKIQFHLQPLTLAGVLEHALETIAPMIESRHQKLHVELPPAALRVRGDLDRLAQCIGNLLTNASKYTPEGGEIWLQAGYEGPGAAVRVRDTGIGIAPEMLSRIFELFAQADQGLAHAQGGLGIGLTLVRSLIQLHGGTVEARSAGQDLGSEFIIRLPVFSEKTPGADQAGDHEERAA